MTKIFHLMNILLSSRTSGRSRKKTDKYEDKGETKYFTKVVAQMVQFLSDSRTDESLIEQPSLAGEEEAEYPF